MVLRKLTGWGGGGISPLTFGPLFQAVEQHVLRPRSRHV